VDCRAIVVVTHFVSVEYCGLYGYQESRHHDVTLPALFSARTLDP
jgi:hypothetical protein